MAEYLPVFTRELEGFIFEKTLFNSSSWKDVKELFEIIKESVNGSCTAIVANHDILYNSYDPTRIPSRILMEDMYREHFSKNPGLLVLPHQFLKIMIYMFINQPWCIIIKFENGFYKISCFSN